TDTVGGTEEVQACLYLNLYLSQFKQGWKYTAIYLLKGRANEPEHESFAFYRLDYKPKMAAHYLHNFTTILADNKSVSKPGKLNYTITNQPNTTHDLLLQKSNGKFVLVLWGERFAGGKDKVTVKLEKKCKTVKIYDPTIGVSAIKTLKMVDTVSLTMTNHPFIIEMN
ncbi:MAG TPA: glycosyl hydrolase, partial [Bacteroidales bacterium]